MQKAARPPSGGKAMNVAVMMAAQDIALRAMVNDLDQLSVDDARNRAEELLDRDDPLFQAITYFATQYELCRYQPDDLARQGRHLRDAVLVATGAVRKLRERRDIDG